MLNPQKKNSKTAATGLERYQKGRSVVTVFNKATKYIYKGSATGQ